MKISKKILCGLSVAALMVSIVSGFFLAHDVAAAGQYFIECDTDAFHEFIMYYSPSGGEPAASGSDNVWQTRIKGSFSGTTLNVPGIVDTNGCANNRLIAFGDATAAHGFITWYRNSSYASGKTEYWGTQDDNALRQTFVPSAPNDGNYTIICEGEIVATRVSFYNNVASNEEDLWNWVTNGGYGSATPVETLSFDGGNGGAFDCSNLSSAPSIVAGGLGKVWYNVTPAQKDAVVNLIRGNSGWDDTGNVNYMWMQCQDYSDGIPGIVAGYKGGAKTFEGLLYDFSGGCLELDNIMKGFGAQDYRDPSWDEGVVGLEFTPEQWNSQIGSWLRSHADYEDVYTPGRVDDPNNPGGVDNDIQSEVECNVSGIGWLLCPVLEGAGHFMESLYRLIEDNFLVVEAEVMDTDGGGLYQAWTVFRDIANIAFIIVFLVIIFSQVTGFGVTNYGIKKMLPRLIITAILVNLSFFICQIAVDISNILGAQLNQFLSNIVPLANNVEQTSQSSGLLGTGALVGVIGIAIAGAVTGGGIFWGAIGSLIALILTGLFAILAMFLILTFRNVAVIILVAIAPIAFVCFVLPNTQNLFKKWTGMMKSMLLLYPLCGILIGGGRLAAIIMNNALNVHYETQPASLFNLFGAVQINTEADAIKQIVIFALQYLPFFALPMLFKSSLAATGKLGAAVSGFAARGRSLGKSLGGKLAKPAKEREQETKATSQWALRRAARKKTRVASRVTANAARAAGAYDDDVQEQLDKYKSEGYKDTLMSQVESGLETATKANVGSDRAGERGVALKGAITNAQIDANNMNVQKLDVAQSASDRDMRAEEYAARIKAGEVAKGRDEVSSALASRITEAGNAISTAAAAGDAAAIAKMATAGGDRRMAGYNEIRGTRTQAAGYMASDAEVANFKKAKTAEYANNPAMNLGQMEKDLTDSLVQGDKATFEAVSDALLNRGPAGQAVLRDKVRSLGAVTNDAQAKMLQDWGANSQKLKADDPIIQNYLKKLVDPSTGRRGAGARSFDASIPGIIENLEQSAINTMDDASTAHYTSTGDAFTNSATTAKFVKALADGTTKNRAVLNASLSHLAGRDELRYVSEAMDTKAFANLSTDALAHLEMTSEFQHSSASQRSAIQTILNRNFTDASMRAQIADYLRRTGQPVDASGNFHIQDANKRDIAINATTGDFA